MPTSTNRPLLIPSLWSDEILRAYEGRVAPPPRMISSHKLKALAEEAADVPQLVDIHDALRELIWRRQQQSKLDRKMSSLKKHIEEVRPQKVSYLRRAMARLKF
jgi:hypothetical protein